MADEPSVLSLIHSQITTLSATVTELSKQVNAWLRDAATKADLQAVKSELEGDIARLRESQEKRSDDLETRVAKLSTEREAREAETKKNQYTMWTAVAVAVLTSAANIVAVVITNLGGPR